MELSPHIVAEIRRRIELYRVEKPGALSPDGKALRVDGSIGYDCWISPEGEVYMETYALDTDGPPMVDRSRRAQILVLALGARTLPELETLLPSRPAGATDCQWCKGAGRFYVGEHRFVCNPCCGLGWVEGGETQGV